MHIADDKPQSTSHIHCPPFSRKNVVTLDTRHQYTLKKQKSQVVIRKCAAVRVNSSAYISDGI
jgi:hypothetical protein